MRDRPIAAPRDRAQKRKGRRPAQRANARVGPAGELVPPLTGHGRVGLSAGFYEKIAWLAQAAKYRADDREVIDSGTEKLDIIERQNTPAGVVWLRTNKAPIYADDGARIGIFGMYEPIEEALATKLLFAKKPRRDTPPKAGL